MITKDIVIIGTGFSGMGVAVKLLESGRTDFVILEKAADVGGTWRDNTYPGCECDIPSHMYSFSWRLNPDWSRNFSAQPEIWAYMRKVADEKGIRPYINFGVEVTGLEWDDDRSVWTVHTVSADGSAEDYEARVVLSGVGGLHIPNVPEIPGAESFAGPRFHSAEWDHSVDLTGKKVAVIGTGASAIQFVPIIAEEVDHLTVFQRTPPWVLGKKDNAIHPVRQKFFDKVPGLTRAYRDAIYWGLEARAIAFNGHLNVLPYAEKLAKANIARAIDDPEMVRKLTPGYRLGCKRVLQSNTYYPTFNRSNVDLVTDHVAEIVPDGVVDANGVKHDADVIVYGTGFHVVDAFDFLNITGRDGMDVGEQFRKHGVETYMGMTIHGVPNLFLMLGPNTALGHNSVVFMIEQQTKYILTMLDELDRRGADVAEVTKPAQDDWNEEIQRLVSKGIWTQGGCKSWYLDAQGKNRTIWPKFTFQYWWETRRVIPEHFTWRTARKKADAAA